MPGLTVDGNGINPTPTMTFFSARGGQTNEGRMTVNGLTVAAAFNGGGVSWYILEPSASTRSRLWCRAAWASRIPAAPS